MSGLTAKCAGCHDSHGSDHSMWYRDAACQSAVCSAQCTLPVASGMPSHQQVIYVQYDTARLYILVRSSHVRGLFVQLSVRDQNRTCPLLLPESVDRTARTHHRSDNSVL